MKVPHRREPALLSFRTGKLTLTLLHHGDEIRATVDHDDESESLFMLTLDGPEGEVRAYNPNSDESEEVYP